MDIVKGAYNQKCPFCFFVFLFLVLNYDIGREETDTLLGAIQR
jgi:hypothetical protein